MASQKIMGIPSGELHFTLTIQKGKTAHAVRVEHLPTGTMAECGREVSTYRNRSVALQMVALGLRLRRGE